MKAKISSYNIYLKNGYKNNNGKIFFNKAFIGKAIKREKIVILDLNIKRKIKKISFYKIRSAVLMMGTKTENEIGVI